MQCVCLMSLLGPISQSYSVGGAAFLSGGESTSSFIQVVGRIQFCVAVGLTSLFPASCHPGRSFSPARSCSYSVAPSSIIKANNDGQVLHGSNLSEPGL